MYIHIQSINCEWAGMVFIPKEYVYTMLFTTPTQCPKFATWHCLLYEITMNCGFLLPLFSIHILKIAQMSKCSYMVNQPSCLLMHALGLLGSATV